MATYLLTGAAGFIASRVASMLLEQGHTVVGIDNLSDAYDVRLKHWRLRQLTNHPLFSFDIVDVSERSQLTNFVSSWHKANTTGFDAVINLAARAGVRPSVENPWTYYECNTIGTLNVLELCREYGIPKLVLASTSSAYGDQRSMPYTEALNTDRPLSPYAASKKAAEVLCYTHHYLFNLDVTVFRYFTVFGPAGRPDMSLFRFVQWISEGRPVTVYGDGTQSRDFTYVDDIARGTIAGLKPLGYEIINLGSDSPLKLIDAIHYVEELVGKKADIRFEPAHQADVQATWADISKAKRLLQWQPQVSFDDGVAELVRWYQENRDWASELET